MALTTSFDVEACGALRLTSCFVPDGHAFANCMGIFFGAAHAALRPGEDRKAKEASIYTDIELDGVSLSLTALASLPKGRRGTIKGAQRVQILQATAAAIECEWAGGFRALVTKHSLFTSEPATLAVMETLLAEMEGGAKELNRESVYVRIHHAEVLEAAGRFQEAAEVYKGCLDDDIRHPELRLLMTSSRVWSYYGLVLKRLARYAEAEKAYAMALRQAASGNAEPDTPWWRETLRITAGQLFISLYIEWRTDKRDGAIRRLFGREMAELSAAGEKQFQYAVMPGGTHFVYGADTRTLFQVVERRRGVSSTSGGEMSFEVQKRVNVDNPGKGLPFVDEVGRDAASDIRNAQVALNRSRGGAAAAKLPPLQCAQCGEQGANFSRCAACRGPAYCGKPCQALHWKEHKKLCSKKA